MRSMIPETKEINNIPSELQRCKKYYKKIFQTSKLQKTCKNIFNIFFR